MIFNASGCGSGLNLKVLAYPTDSALLSAKPNANTIGVITDTNITSWIFSPHAPTEQSEGMLWIAIDTSSHAEFNVLNTNGIILCPIAAYQSIGGEWIQKTAKSYIGETWKEWYTYIFNNGAINETLTGGINGTIQDNKIHFDSSVAAGQSKSYTTRKKIDLTNATVMKAVVKSSCTDTQVYFRLFVDETLYNGERVTNSGLVALIESQSPFEDVREVALDVTGLNGEYYVGYSWGVKSSASGSRDASGDVERWWLE